MPSYPILTSGRTFCEGFSRLTEYRVKKWQFADGSSQRVRSAQPLERFTLIHTRLSTAERNQILTFFDGRKGDYDEFDLTIDGTTFNHIRFDGPEITSTQAADLTWSMTVPLAQWRKN